MHINWEGSIAHHALLTRCRLELEGSSGIGSRGFMGKSVKKELRTIAHPGTGVSCTSQETRPILIGGINHKAVSRFRMLKLQ